MGTRRLYDFVDHNPDVELRPVDYVNNPFVIAQNENMVSINSCVQVDLMGQVVSTSVGTAADLQGWAARLTLIRGATLFVCKGGPGPSWPCLSHPPAEGQGLLKDRAHSWTPALRETDHPQVMSTTSITASNGIAQLRGKTLPPAGGQASVEIAAPATAEKNPISTGTSPGVRSEVPAAAPQNLD